MHEEHGPSVPAVTEDRVGVLAAYVGTNRDRFTDEALRTAARAAGYTDDEITAAWSAAAGPATAIPGDRRIRTGIVVVTAIAYVIALYAANIGLSALAVGDIVGLVAIGGLLGGIVGWVVLRGTRPSLARGLGWGVILAVGLPLVVVLGILGICLVGGGSFLFGG